MTYNLALGVRLSSFKTVALVLCSSRFWCKELAFLRI